MRARARRLAVLNLALLGAFVLSVLVFAPGCSSTIENRDPTGEPFPAVTGNSLEKEPVRLPDDFSGQPVIVLVGYEQETQFDIDRWLMGLIQSEVDVPIVEVPTIPGLTASFASGWIDDGMRSGIPREDWGAVVTLYGKAARPVAELTGTEFGRRTRVLLLDAEGQVAWFDDEGYSARKALELAGRATALAQ